LKSQDVETFCVLGVFGKKDRLLESLQNSVAEGFIMTPIDMLRANIMKFG